MPHPSVTSEIVSPLLDRHKAGGSCKRTSSSVVCHNDSPAERTLLSVICDLGCVRDKLEAHPCRAHLTSV